MTMSIPASAVTTARLMESAGLLLLFSFFALIEGTIRMTANSKPTVDVDYFATETPDGTRIIPVVVFLAAGVAEVIFGISGVFVAFFALFLGHNNPTHTKHFATLQCVLGWFVFLTFVIADPIMRASQAKGTPLLSKNEQIALILLGNMLGSICFCYALQGGQFIFALRLMAVQNGEEDSKPKNKLRATIWSVNMFLASFSTLFVGILLQSKNFTSSTAPVGAPPHVVWQPMFSIFCGIIMLAYAFCSYGSISQPAINKNMPMAWVVTTMFMMLNFSWLFGIVPGLAPPIPGSAQHSGLVLSVTILPIFHTIRTHTVLGDSDDSTDSKERGGGGASPDGYQDGSEQEQPAPTPVQVSVPAPVRAPAPAPAAPVPVEDELGMSDPSNRSLHV